MTYYEEPQDVVAQDKVGNRVAFHLAMCWRPYHGKNAPVDGFLYGTSLQAVVEVKCREPKYRDYVDYTVDLEKIEKLLDLAEALRITPYYVARFPSELLIYEPYRQDLKAFETGEQTHGIRQTTKIVIHIPWVAFRVMEVAGG